MFNVETLAVTGSEPVALEDAKRQVRVEQDVTDDDELIGRLILAARQRVENWTGQVLRESTLRITFSGFANPLRLPRAPISEVTSVAYGEDTVDDYRLLTEVGVSVLRPALDACWPYTRESVVVDVAAGYAEGEVPDDLIHAILITVAAWYEDRAAGELPPGAMALMADYKLSWL